MIELGNNGVFSFLSSSIQNPFSIVNRKQVTHEAEKRNLLSLSLSLSLSLMLRIMFICHSTLIGSKLDLQLLLYCLPDVLRDLTISCSLSA